MVTEKELAEIWEGQRFPPEALVTVDGRAVEVVHPGRRGGFAGPDFVEAVVRLDGVERRGDVELHVLASLFRGHGHERDPAYANLALHVVYRADAGAETRLCGGGRAPVAAFEPWLQRRGAELQGWLAAPSMWEEPCRDAVSRLGRGGVSAVLQTAGERRFRERAERLGRQVAALGEEEALWRVLLDTLGAGGDREGFRRLAAAFPASLAARLAEGELEAALVEVAGLGSTSGPAGLPEQLRPGLRARGRPANHPRRRLAGLARLYKKASIKGKEGPLAGLALVSVTESRRAGELVARWTVAPEIGVEKAQELVTNVALPFAALRGLEDAALGWLAALPAPAYGRTAFLEAYLRPERGRGVRGALEQQGLLGLIETWCGQGGCGRCPLS